MSIFSVEPQSVEIKVGQSAQLTIALPDGQQEFTVTGLEGYATFDKGSKQITGIKEVTQGTMTFTCDGTIINVTVSVNPADEAGIIKRTEKYENQTNITKGYFKDVRLIEDGKDYVSAQYTNRPHKDTLENLDIISNIEDIRGLHSSGEWNTDEAYNKGEIVSFLSEYFISLKDENTNNIPVLSSQKAQDDWWKPICNTADVKVSDFTPKERHNQETDKFYPFTNGKAVTSFAIKAGTTYTLFRMSKLIPFKEKLTLYFDFRGDQSANLSVSYVECDILYTGLKNNTSGTMLPELRFGACHTSLIDTAEKIPFSANNVLTPYDKFGAYGISMQTSIRNDGLVDVAITAKWNCTMTISGEYNNTPYVASEVGSVGALPVWTINHLVRPNGGNNVTDLGEILAFKFPMSDKQIWDKGLINVAAERKLYASEYSLLALALGYWVNLGDTKTGSIPTGAPSVYYNTGQDIKIQLPTIAATPAGATMYMRGF